MVGPVRKRGSGDVDGMTPPFRGLPQVVVEPDQCVHDCPDPRSVLSQRVKGSPTRHG